MAGTLFSDTVKADDKSPATRTQTAKDTQEVTDVGTMSVHVGANENQVILIDIPAVTSYTLGTENLNVMTSVTASEAIDTIDTAVAYANRVRSQMGAYENRFEHTTNNLGTASENLTSAISTMTDTDMAEEMPEYTSLNVMTQAAKKKQKKKQKTQQKKKKHKQQLLFWPRPMKDRQPYFRFFSKKVSDYEK